MGGDMDDRVVVPLTTAMRRLFNVTTLTMVRVRVDSVSDVKRVAYEIRALMHERHQIRPPDLDDFRVVASDAVAALSRAVSGTLKKILITVTTLSLIVGGIVLMNLMLLSVTERRHEIGLRRALGGKRRDILLQFLFESIILTSAGGLAGLVLGIGAAMVVGRVTTTRTVLSWEPLVLAAALSLLIGLVFGLVPARQASKMPPVRALR
jgi:putative ABC transport system permease protein